MSVVVVGQAVEMQTSREGGGIAQGAEIARFGVGKFRVGVKRVLNLARVVAESEGQVILEGGNRLGGVIPKGNLPETVLADDVILNEDVFGFGIFLGYNGFGQY